MAGIHRKRRKRHTPTPAYMAMVGRMLKAGEPRIAEDPAGGLALAHELEAAATEMVNVGIYLANQGGQSYNQLADLLGVSKAAVIKRAHLGEEISARRRPARRAAAGPAIAAPRQLPPGESAAPR